MLARLLLPVLGERGEAEDGGALRVLDLLEGLLQLLLQPHPLGEVALHDRVGDGLPVARERGVGGVGELDRAVLAAARDVRLDVPALVGGRLLHHVEDRGALLVHAEDLVEVPADDLLPV